MNDDLSSESDVESDVKKVRKPTLSEIYFTPSERDFRHQYRLNKSYLCLREAWKLYNKLIDKDRPNPEDDEMSEMIVSMTSHAIKRGVLHDPTMYRRNLHLLKQYRHFRDGLSRTIKVPERPYLYIQNSPELDSPSRRHVMPRAIRAFRPEVVVTSSPPFESTFAYTNQWMNVANLNFVAVNEVVSNFTQTSAELIVFQPSLYKKGQSEPGPQDKRVDLLDVPVDEDGNPAGKRTGCCEWCGKEILPIPTPFVLAHTWDKSTLFCCQKYQDLIQEVGRFEQSLLDDRAEQELLLDLKVQIRPKTENESDEGAVSSVGSLEPKMFETQVYTPGRLILEALEKRKEARAVPLKSLTLDECVDTQDLPWDPYMTRFKKPRPFNDSVFDDPLDHEYRHADIVLHQSEVYAEVDILEESRSPDGSQGTPTT